ncbi:MAG: hypothetical protein R6U52_06520 [Kosmotogaceae bacterium]
MKNSHVLLLIGAIAIIVALFLPALTVNAQNQMANVSDTASYFESDEVFGAIILILSIGTFLLVFIKKTELVWITSLTTIGLLIFRFFKFLSDISSINSMQQQLGNIGEFGTNFNEMGNINQASMSVSLNPVSWIVFFIGGILLIIGLIKANQKTD